MKLICVYNADEGLFNALTDTVHKVFSPHTYECRLCHFTHGTFGMLHQWKTFLQSLRLPLAFYHRKEFAQSFGRSDIPLPVILLERDGELQMLVSADEISACESLHGLMERVRTEMTARSL